MRSWPALWINGNIVWSADDGAPWAVFELEESSYLYLSTEKKKQFARGIQTMFAALPRHSMLVAVHREADMDDTYKRLTQNVDPGRTEWFRRARAMADGLDTNPLFDRHLFLFARLSDSEQSLKERLYAAWNGFFDDYYAMTPPSSTAQTKAAAASQLLENTIRSANVDIAAATPAQIRWLFLRSVTRGLPIASQPEPDWSPDQILGQHNSGFAGASSVAASEAVFTESHARRLEVKTQYGVSYQAFHAMAEMPAYWEFPGSGGEFCLAVNQLGFHVDWAMRIEAVPNAEAAAKARRKQRELNHQFEEWEADPSGAPETLTKAIVDIEAQHNELHASSSAPELIVNVVLAIGAETPGALDEMSSALRTRFESSEYSMPRPIGEQWALYRSMLPGADKPGVFRSYFQVLMPPDLASTVPTAGTKLGDPYGILFGRSGDSGADKAVFMAPEYGPTINRSASLAICGALGSGKSYAAKVLADHALARGARVIAVDRTSMGEYVNFGDGAPGEVDAIQITADANVSFDPLRLFPKGTAKQVAQGFLTLLCQVSATSPEALILGDAIDQITNEGRPLGAIVDQLELVDAEDEPVAREVRRKLRYFSSTALGGIVFDPTRRPARWDADYTVIHTPGLDIPDREVLLSEHLSKNLGADQIMATAILYAIAALCRHAIFEDPKRHAIALMDEAWWLTSSMQGEALLKESIRDGRKHNAAVWLSSQSPEDFDAGLAALFGMRAAFRQGQNLGASAARFMGLHATEQNIELLESKLRTGECLWSDVNGNVGRVQFDRAVESLHRRLDTNPETARRRQRRAATHANSPGPGRGPLVLNGADTDHAHLFR